MTILHEAHDGTKDTKVKGTRTMNPDLLLPLALTFVAVALASGSVTSMLLARTAPERRRLTPTRTDEPHTSFTEPDHRGAAGHRHRRPNWRSARATSR